MRQPTSTLLPGGFGMVKKYDEDVTVGVMTRA